MISVGKTPCTRGTGAQQGFDLKQFVRHMPSFSRSSLKLPRTSDRTCTDAFHCLFLALVTLSCYWNSLEGDFVHDDISAIVTNGDVTGETPLMNLLVNDFWGESLSSQTSHKSHRPLTTLSFRLNAVIHGMNTFGYHTVNIALHITVVIVLYHLCRHLLRWSYTKSTFAALLFAVHPVHTEAVSNIVGRADILATLFFLLSILSYTRGQRSRSAWQVTSLLLATMSFLSKEQGITSFLFIISYDVICSHPTSTRRKDGGKFNRLEIYNCIKSRIKSGNMTFLVAAFVLMAIRILLMGAQLPIFSQEDNPASYSHCLKTRFLTYGYLATMNAWLSLSTSTLSYDWQIGSVPLVNTFSDRRNLATVSLVTFIIAFIYYLFTTNKIKEKRMLCLGFILPVLAFLPASNLFFYVGFVIAERILYMPSLGLCIVVCHGVHKLYYKLVSSSGQISQGMCRLLFFVFISILLLSNIIRTHRRNQVWLSRKALFQSGVRDLPQNAKMHYNYGNLLKDEGDIAGAERHYRRAIREWPYYASAHNNLATVVNDSSQAIYHFQQAITYNPRHSRAFYNLALIHNKKNLTSSAISLLETAIALDKSLVEAHSKLASMYFSVGRFRDAEIIHKRIMSMKMDNADLANNYGVFLEQIGRTSEAMKYYKMALEKQPGHVYAIINVCRILEAEGKLREAKNMYESYSENYEYNAEIMDNLGSLLIRLYRFEEAVNLYEELLRKVPNHSRAKIHYAQILMDQNQLVKAEDLLLSIVNRSSCKDQLAIYQLSSVYKKMNRTTEAVEHILMAISACDGTCDVCANLYVLHGDVMKHLNYLDQAAQSYKMALDLKPGLYHAHVNLGAIYHIQSEFNQAWRHYLAAKVLHPTHPILLENMAKLERAQMSSLTCDDSSMNSCWR